jgi:glutamyl-tRNA synthetase
MLPILLKVVTVLRHKKYAPAGKKSQFRLNKIWLDQADAQEIKEGEEVTLMDWGNMIVKVKTSRDAECKLEVKEKLFFFVLLRVNFTFVFPIN